MQDVDDDIRDRIARLTAEMADRNLDAVLLDDCEAMHYFIGYDISMTLYRACVIRRDGTGFVVLRALDVLPLQEKTWVKDVVGYPDWVPADEAIAEAVKARGLGKARIGIDLASQALTNQMFAALKRGLSDVEFVDIDNLPWKMRRIKSAKEIGYLRRAAEIADLALQAVVDIARPGVTEREAAAVAMECFLRNGGDPGMLGIITAGNGWGFLHGHLHDVPLQAGQVLHIELCPRYQGYGARVMRCVAIGGPSPELARISDTLIDLQDKQLAALKPGAVAKDVDAILRQGALSAGIRDTYDNITGYTLGYYADQPLRASDFTWIFHPKAEWTVEEGMAFHMYTSAGGIAISETVVIGPNGAERLTKFPRKLFTA
jgi:Xaa-Pro aminopeptidase